MQTSDDFDGCWKEALDCYFPGFMHLLWPRIASQIDWRRQPEFLDQELQKLVGSSETGARRVDKLVKVWMRDGTERWFLVHVEIQARLVSGFAPRELTYYTRLRDRYDRVIESLVVITHGAVPSADRRTLGPSYRWRYIPREPPEAGAPGIELNAMLPGFHQLEYDARSPSGNGLVFHFSVAHLSEWRPAWSVLERLGRYNPFALVIMAQLEAVASREGPRRFVSKVGIMRLMYSYRYTRDDVTKVLQLIDWMIRLPEELEPVFNEEVRRIEAEDEMTYVTSFERVGEARGQKSGQTEMLRRQLTHKFGPLPDWVDTKLAEADKDQILTWADRVLDEASLQAVFQP
jgi:hypothetical protein